MCELKKEIKKWGWKSYSIKKLNKNNQKSQPPRVKGEGEKEMKIRERITELTMGVKTQVDLDRLVSSGLLKTIKAEFPNADPAEIFYEWDARKMQIKKMVEED